MSKINPISAILMFLRVDDDYMKSSKAQILKRNNTMLRVGSVIYALVLLFYTMFTYLLYGNHILFNTYLFFDIVHLFITIVVFSRPQKHCQNYKYTNALCIFLELTVLVFFLVESTLVFSDIPAKYISIAIFCVFIVFTHSARYFLVLIVCYPTVFVIGSFYFKDYMIFENDLYIGIATLISALICYIIMSELRHKEAQSRAYLEKLGTIDRLTNLFNKATMDQLCSSYIEDLYEDHKGSFAIVIVDIDNFKDVNDRFGHQVGDAVLISIAKLIKDSFYEKDYVGRFGGDEFYILMTDDAGSKEVIEAKAKIVLSKVNELSIPQLDNGNFHISCSLGITYVAASASNACTLSYDRLFKNADDELYKAKDNGKNSYSIYEIK